MGGERGLGALGLRAAANGGSGYGSMMPYVSTNGSVLYHLICTFNLYPGNMGTRQAAQQLVFKSNMPSVFHAKQMGSNKVVPTRSAQTPWRRRHGGGHGHRNGLLRRNSRRLGRRHERRQGRRRQAAFHALEATHVPEVMLHQSIGIGLDLDCFERCWVRSIPTNFQAPGLLCGLWKLQMDFLLQGLRHRTHWIEVAVHAQGPIQPIVLVLVSWR